MSDQVGAKVHPLADGDAEKQRLLDKIWLGAIGVTARVEAAADRHERLHNRGGKVEGVDRR